MKTIELIVNGLLFIMLLYMISFVYTIIEEEFYQWRMRKRSKKVLKTKGGIL